MVRGIADVCNLVGTKYLPWLADECVVKSDDVAFRLEVDESVANVAVVCEVDAKIRKVVAAEDVLVKDGLEHVCIDLVGDVPDHDGRTTVLALLDSMNVDFRVLLVELPSQMAGSTHRSDRRRTRADPWLGRDREAGAVMLDVDLKILLLVSLERQQTCV